MADAVHDARRLEELRALPLERKIQISQARIIEWYKHYDGNVVVSFSGGKDSTVLLHLVRSIFPDVKAVFSNTGLEYPEIQKHVMGIENVDIIRPSMRFDEVISTYGYPLIGKEVAEAIYYARRIRSTPENVGGCADTEQANRNARSAAKLGRVESTESDRESASLPTDSSSHRDERSQEPENGPHGNDGRQGTGDRAGVVTTNMGGVLRDSTQTEQPTSTVASGETTTDGACTRTRATRTTKTDSGIGGVQNSTKCSRSRNDFEGKWQTEPRGGRIGKSFISGKPSPGNGKSQGRRYAADRRSAGNSASPRQSTAPEEPG